MKAKQYTEFQIINKSRVKGKFNYPQLIGFILLNLSIFSCNPSLGPSHLPESVLNDSLITTPSPSQEPSKAHPQESQILSPESPSNIESPESTSKIYTNSAGMSFVSLPEGNFIMGSPGGLIWAGKDEYPQHSVTVSAFQMMTTEVTKEQWWAVMGSYPFKPDTDFSQDGSGYDYSAGNHYPMYGISWCDIVGKSGDPLHCHIPVGESFLDKLNASGTGTYRLPTEAEWEYAARAGSDTEYACGDWVAYDKDNPDVCPYNMGWFYDNQLNARGFSGGATTQPVATKQPNSWGLYDMHGNVMEWVQDYYVEDWYKKTVGGSYPRINPIGPDILSPPRRVIRGGHVTTATAARSAGRSSGHPAIQRINGVGFRLVREL